jgi:pimeloyl-ACP methyl ester carboxylesterase
MMMDLRMPPVRLGVPSMPRSSGARAATILGAAAMALGASALWTQAQARRAEREHPPLGRSLQVDGVRLHYVERGHGQPLVLIHGLMTMIQDWGTSGVLDRAAERYRVIAFDRPGYGYSTRPRDRVWTPAAQADLIHKALGRLGVEQAVVVGHSLGTVVALELALRHPASVAALALLSGYYFPTARVDAPVQALPAVPVLGDIMRYTISPLLLRLAWPGLMRVLFGPAPTNPAFDALKGLVARPEQIRASASESALLVPTVAGLQQHYTELKVPVVIAAGAEDRYVGTEAQSARLHQMLPGSGYRVVPGAGHMMHHTAPDEAMAAIDLAASRVEKASARPQPWLAVG